MQFVSGFLGLLDQISNVLDIPSKFLGILGLISTVGGYLTGRRASRGQNPEALVAATLAQLGYAAPGAAPGVAPPGGTHAGAVAEAPPARPQPSSLPSSVAPSAASTPLAPAPVTALPAAGAAYVAGALAQPVRAQRKSLWQRASYPWLAIVSIVSLFFSVLSYVFVAASSAGQNDTALTLLGLFGILTWGVGLATIIWGAVHALRLRRWGWLTSVVLIGLAGMLFLVPSVITLLFALVGPKARRAPKGAPLPLGAYAYPRGAGPQAAPSLWMPQHGSPQPWAPAASPPQPMPFPAAAQQPTSYPGWQQPPTNPPLPQHPAVPQQPWTYPPGFSPAPSPSQPLSYPPAMMPQMPQRPAPQPNPAIPVQQAGPGSVFAPPSQASPPPPPDPASSQPPAGPPGPDQP